MITEKMNLDIPLDPKMDSNEGFQTIEPGSGLYEDKISAYDKLKSKSGKINFLQETILFLEHHNKSPKDVIWVGNTGRKFDWMFDDDINILLTKIRSFTWDEFTKFADFEYDNGYGHIIINEALVVVGKDWWIERHEYDGSEWWEFKTLPSSVKNEESNLDCLLQQDIEHAIRWGGLKMRNIE